MGSMMCYTRKHISDTGVDYRHEISQNEGEGTCFTVLIAKRLDLPPLRRDLRLQLGLRTR